MFSPSARLVVLLEEKERIFVVGVVVMALIMRLLSTRLKVLPDAVVASPRSSPKRIRENMGRGYGRGRQVRKRKPLK